MTRTILAIAFLITGCDVDEGPKEEAREATQAMRDGKPLQDVGEELGEAGDSLRKDLDQRLDKAGNWIDARTREIEDGSREVGDDVKAQLQKLGEKLEKARKDLAEASEEAADDLAKTVDEIEAEMAELLDDEEH